MCEGYPHPAPHHHNYDLHQEPSLYHGSHVPHPPQHPLPHPHHPHPTPVPNPYLSEQGYQYTTPHSFVKVSFEGTG